MRAFARSLSCHDIFCAGGELSNFSYALKRISSCTASATAQGGRTESIHSRHPLTSLLHTHTHTHTHTQGSGYCLRFRALGYRRAPAPRRRGDRCATRGWQETRLMPGIHPTCCARWNSPFAPQQQNRRTRAARGAAHQIAPCLSAWKSRDSKGCRKIQRRGQL